MPELPDGGWLLDDSEVEEPLYTERARKLEDTDASGALDKGEQIVGDLCRGDTGQFESCGGGAPAMSDTVERALEGATRPIREWSDLTAEQRAAVGKRVVEKSESDFTHGIARDWISNRGNEIAEELRASEEFGSGNASGIRAIAHMRAVEESRAHSLEFAKEGALRAAANWEAQSDVGKIQRAYSYNALDGVPRPALDEPKRVDALGWDSNTPERAATAMYAEEVARERFMDMLAVAGMETKAGRGTGAIAAVWDEWKSSSSGGLALVMQRACAEEFGAGVVHEGKVKINTEERAAERFSKYFKSDGAGLSADRGRAGMRAYVRSVWETTQHLLKKDGVTHVEVYRAVFLPKSAIKKLRNGNGSISGLVLAKNGASSWTVTPGVANSWMGTGSRRGPDDVRVVFRARVPRESVLSVPVYGRNLHGEREVVLIPGKFDALDAWYKHAPSPGDHPPLQPGGQFQDGRSNVVTKAARLVVDLDGEAENDGLGNWLNALRMGKGDFEGHPFRGNQYTDVAGASEEKGSGLRITVPASLVEPGTKMSYGGGKGYLSQEQTQPGGAPLRGEEAISVDDPRIPGTVYHVTTNLPAVEKSGFLRAGGAGGLGGDSNDRIVSMTLDKDVAERLSYDIKLNAEIGKLGSPQAVFERLQAEAVKEGWQFGGNLSDAKGKLAEYLEYRWTDIRTQFFVERQSKTGKLNPIFFGNEGKGVDPSNVGIVEIPKKNLRTGALLVNFDLSNRFGLKEIRSYGDIPLKKSADRLITPWRMEKARRRVEAKIEPALAHLVRERLERQKARIIKLVRRKIAEARARKSSNVWTEKAEVIAGDLCRGETGQFESCGNPGLQGSKEFKRWFGDSVVTDRETSKQETWKPKVVYHGTKGSFTAFEPGREGTNSNVFGSWKTKREGIFFTEDPEVASGFAEAGLESREVAGQRVIPVFLRIENAADLTDGFPEDVIEAAGKAGLNTRFFSRLSGGAAWEAFDHENYEGVEDGAKKFVEVLKSLGYDGARMKEYDNNLGRSSAVWVAFDPSQVKSATGNVGGFDPSSSDVTKAENCGTGSGGFQPGNTCATAEEGPMTGRLVGLGMTPRETQDKYWDIHDSDKVTAWRRGLSSEQRESLRTYAGGAYWDMNNVLRGRVPVTREFATKYAELRRVVENAPKLDAAVKVFRGLTFHGDDADVVARFVEHVGKDVRLAGLQSASLSEPVAERFAGGKRSVVLEIETDRGAVIGDLGPRGEFEILLGHAWKYRVERVEDKPGKPARVRLKMLGAWSPDDAPILKTARKRDEKFKQPFDAVEFLEAAEKAENGEKFKRVAAFAGKIAGLRAAVATDLKSDDTRVREIAAIVGLIDKTYMRIGGGDSEEDTGSVGATSLRVEHVTKKGGSLRLKFDGKSGVAWDREVSDAALVGAIGKSMEGKKASDALFSVSSEAVNAWLKDKAGITSKDFRTFHASRLARELLGRAGRPEDPKDREKKVKEVVERVAEQLNHTPGVSRSTYIEPGIINAYLGSAKAEKAEGENCGTGSGGFQEGNTCGRGAAGGEGAVRTMTADELRESLPKSEKGKQSYSGVGVDLIDRVHEFDAEEQDGLRAVVVRKDGGRVYLYTSEHKERQAKAKFAKSERFAEAVDGVRERITADMNSGDARTREAATVAALIDDTYMRIGGGRTEARTGSVGATTLRAMHVKEVAGGIKFTFPGKSGVAWERVVTDPDLVKAVRAQIQGKASHERVFSVDRQEVNSYLGRVGGITAKDFRTYHASRIVFEELSRASAPANAKEAKAVVKGAIEKAATALGHTPAVSKSTYVNPVVIERFLERVPSKRKGAA